MSGGVREAAEALLLAMDARALRGHKHVPAMRDEQDARLRLRKALDATPTPPIEGRDADVERVRSALVDLVSWFPESGPSVYGPWIIKAGEYGADDAIADARAALQALGERP